MNIGMQEAPTTWNEVGPAPAACAAGTAIEVRAGRSTALNRASLYVRCNDGPLGDTIEVYEYAILPERFAYRAVLMPGPFTSWTWVSVEGEDIVAVIREATNAVELYALDVAAGAFDSIAVHVLPGAIAVRDHESPEAPAMRTDFTGVTGVAFPATPCPLSLHAGGLPDDLHLASGANDCVDGADSAAAYTRSDDIDGESTRTDGAPDVGADEWAP